MNTYDAVSITTEVPGGAPFALVDLLAANLTWEIVASTVQLPPRPGYTRYQIEQTGEFRVVVEYDKPDPPKTVPLGTVLRRGLLVPGSRLKVRLGTGEPVVDATVIQGVYDVLWPNALRERFVLDFVDADVAQRFQQAQIGA